MKREDRFLKEIIKDSQFGLSRKIQIEPFIGYEPDKKNNQVDIAETSLHFDSCPECNKKLISENDRISVSSFGFCIDCYSKKETESIIAGKQQQFREKLRLSALKKTYLNFTAEIDAYLRKLQSSSMFLEDGNVIKFEGDTKSKIIEMANRARKFYVDSIAEIESKLKSLENSI